jgi:O-antigen ligase
LWGEKHAEAQESYESRSYLFEQSVRFTLQHPVFGVGPDQFSNYEGMWSRKQGQRGNWHATHCAYTQVSSECGIPALLFFLGSLGSAWLLVNRAYRMAKQKGYEEIKNACFCYLLAMVGFLTAIIFLANAYSFHLPAMVGLGVCLGLTAMREIETSDANKPAPDVWPMPLQGRT